MPDIKDEIQAILSKEDDQKAFESIPEEDYSPLNQAVVEKHFGNQEQQQNPPASAEGEMDDEFHVSDEDLDAPEQEIDEHESDDNVTSEKESFELPTAHAQQAADAILGVTDNLLEVGGGFFVKIRKHKLFFDFEEVIQVIDQQNEKNVQRIKLEPEDKILLRPLLAAVLKKRAQRLTPEQQLLGAVVSILFKKVQIVAEIRAENEFLVERILHIIKEESEGESKAQVAVPLEEREAKTSTKTVEEAVLEVD